MITINEHKSPNYSPRTYHNAHSADLTVAFAVSFYTAGERLTKKAALSSKNGDLAYLSIDLNQDALTSARSLYSALKRIEKHTGKPTSALNVAGNGIYTLSKVNIDQNTVNRYVHDVIAKVHEFIPFTHIVSGGQTGVDMAGAVAGASLNIPVTLTYPKGFRVRYTDGKDVDETPENLHKMLAQQIEELKQVPLIL